MTQPPGGGANTVHLEGGWVTPSIEGTVDFSLDALADTAIRLITTIFGGKNGGEETPPEGGEETPPEGGEETPPDERTGGRTGTSPTRRRVVPSCDAIMQELKKLRAEKVAVRGSNLVASMPSDTKVTIQMIRLAQPLSLSPRMKQKYGLKGNWFIKPGTYILMKNTLKLPLVKR